MDWCKIVDHEEYGQILAVRKSSDEGEPAISVSINPGIEGIDLYSTAFCYEDSDEGYQKRDDVWREQYLGGDEMMFDVAEALLADLIQMLKG